MNTYFETAMLFLKENEICKSSHWYIELRLLKCNNRMTQTTKWCYWLGARAMYMWSWKCSCAGVI